MLTQLTAALKEHAPEYDAIINLAKMPRSEEGHASLMDGEALFEEYERVKRYKIQSSLLMGHLAS